MLSKFRQNIIRMAQNRRNTAEEVIEDFATAFQANPLYTVEWKTDKVIEYCTLKYLAESVLTIVEDEDRTDEQAREQLGRMFKEVERGVLQKASWPESSTSVFANQKERITLATLANAIGDYGGFLSMVMCEVNDADNQVQTAEAQP